MLTRHRLSVVRNAIAAQYEMLKQVLSPLEPENIPLEAVRKYLARPHDVLPRLWHNFTNLFRDWSWGELENASVLNAIMSGIPSRTRIMRMLVPGSGGCRLAYDLHRTLRPAQTIATEMNPLLFFAAKRILAGSPLSLYEFPVRPRDLSSVAVRRTLRAEHGPAGRHLELFFDDFTDSCFPPASFDCVVTSWFIDVLKWDVLRLSAEINRLLVHKGLWINLGPQPSGDAPERTYSPEEILEFVAWAGFSVINKAEHTLPFLQSPAGAVLRTDRCIRFTAMKTSDGRLGSHRRPSWLASREAPNRRRLEVEGRRCDPESRGQAAHWLATLGQLSIRFK